MAQKAPAVYPVTTPSGSYSVLVGLGCFEAALAKDLVNPAIFGKASSLVIVTDANVLTLWGSRLLGALAAASAAGAPVPANKLLVVIPPGEAFKTRQTKEFIEDAMLAAGCHRDTVVLAFGGGVVGDLAGFVASTYMRGVRLVHVPTTLLAMVDSSIGGKTGLDVPAGKNLVGAFWQPSCVYIDASLLVTLPPREVSNGYAEVVKTGAIADAGLFELCESRPEALLGWEVAEAGAAFTDEGGGAWAPQPMTAAALAAAHADWRLVSHPALSSVTSPPCPVYRAYDWALVTSAIAASVAVKAAVVSGDEREGGARALLNFGHTVGHALEAALQPAWLHGECVSVGMVREVEAARALGLSVPGLVGRLKSTLTGLKLPVVQAAATTRVPDNTVEAGVAPSEDCLLDRVMSYMAIDKKNSRSDGGAAVRCVLLTDVGAPLVAGGWTHPVPAAVVKRLLSTVLEVTPYAAPLSSAAVAPMRVRVPGSKSLSNRALLLAALAGGPGGGATRLAGLLVSDDTQVMMEALRKLGAGIVVEADPVAGRGKVHRVAAIATGAGGALPPPPPAAASLYVGNAGTAARFLTALLAVMTPPAGASSGVVLSGNARMQERPVAPLVEALQAQGARIIYEKTPGCFPLRFISGITSDVGCPTLPPETRAAGHRVVRLAAKLSSQYVSALLLAAPFFPPLVDTSGASFVDDGTVEIVLEEDTPTSLPYILMTIATIADFGVAVTRVGSNRFLVPRRPYSPPGAVASGGGPGYFSVEADASSASYFAALAAVTGRTVVLEGCGSASTQGDAGFPLLLRGMGCTVEQGPDTTTVTGPPRRADGTSGLTGISVNMADTTDCFMTLCAVAAVAHGETRIVGIANQRVKECDRIAAMVKELGKVGITASELPDGIVVTGAGARLGQLQEGAGQASSFSTAASRSRLPPVHCYDDHRIAMSFAVLGTTWPGIRVDQAWCVEKTYPEFWDDLTGVGGIEVTPAPLNAPGAAGHAIACRPSTIFVVGMRGAGKSFLGSFAGGALAGARFTDMDAVLEAEASAEAGGVAMSVSDIVATHGWEGFRAREAALLSRLADGARDASAGGLHIVACGGGIVETPVARDTLKAHAAAGGVVVWVVRDVADIEADLTAAAGGHRPSYPGGATLADVYERRRPWFEDVATHLYVILPGDREWTSYHGPLFARLLGYASGGARSDTAPVLAASCAAANGAAVAPPWPLLERRVRVSGEEVPLFPADGTSFVCLNLPSIAALGGGTSDATLAAGPAAAAAADVATPSAAVELRADFWDPVWTASRAAVATQVAMVRKALVAGVLSSSALPPSMALAGLRPLIFTLRTTSEGGRYPAEHWGSPACAALYAAAIAAGVECIDVGDAAGALQTLVTSASTSASTGVIFSFHDTKYQESRYSRTSGSDEVAAVLAALPPLAARASPLARAVTAYKCAVALPHAGAAADFAAFTARAGAATRSVGAPLIAVGMGPHGAASRAACATLCPVTHPRLPTPAAPGQLDVAGLYALRRTLGLVAPRAYALFGSPISASPSPAMHAAAFAALHLPHSYTRVETTDVEAVREALLSPRAAFAGGNVTVPLKEAVLPLCTHLSPEAAAIGAVNTLVVVPTPAAAIAGSSPSSTQLYGHNTDWLGIYLPVKARLQGMGAAHGSNHGRGTVASATTPICSRSIGLVVGAGGTARAAAYALARLGLEVAVYNPRTPTKAAEVAAAVGGVAVQPEAPTVQATGSEGGPDQCLTPAVVLAALGAGTSGASHAPVHIKALVSTLPAAAGWVAPLWLLSTPKLYPSGASPSPAPLVVMDVCYRPAVTPLLAAASEASAASSSLPAAAPSALCVGGAEMLAVQGAASFALWTGRTHPDTLRGLGLQKWWGAEPEAALFGVPMHLMYAAAVAAL